MAKKKSVFSPEKDYEWSKDATIEISGEEFGMMRLLVNSVLGKEEVMRARHLEKVLQSIVVAKVEDGTFTEVIKDVIELEAEEVK